jgi:cytochrome c
MMVDRSYEQAGGWRRALRRSALPLKQDWHVDCSIAQLQPERHRAGHAQPSPPPPAASEPDVPLSPSERRGFRLVRLNCARCHAIDKVSESPLAIASPFRTLHLKYPVSDLQRLLAQGVHPVMPRFQFEASQVEDIMAYLKTLER